MGPRWVPKNLQRKKNGLFRLLFWSTFGNFIGVHFGDHFGQLFGHFLDHFWVPFWGPFWDQIGQRGGKMSPREPSGASKSQKAAFSKTLKNLKFFSVLDAEASQENFKRPEKAPKRHPKRHPKVVQNLVKKWSKSEPKTEQKKRFRIKKNRSDRFLCGPFLRPWGLLKTLTSKKKKTVPK